MLAAFKKELALATDTARGQKWGVSNRCGKRWAARQDLRGKHDLKLFLRSTWIVGRSEDLGELDDTHARDKGVLDGGDGVAPLLTAKCINEEALVCEGDSRVNVGRQVENVTGGKGHVARVWREETVADVEPLDLDSSWHVASHVGRPSARAGAEVENECALLERQGIIQDQAAAADVIADEVVLLVEPKLLVAVGGKAVRAVRIIVRLAL